MALTGDRTFVGFGFGAIQAGLFLYEAYRAGTFSRLVCAEIQAERIARVRAAGGMFTVNIAHADRIEQARVGPVELLNPADPTERAALVAAVAAAAEAATALPSVAGYADVAPILAAGLAAKHAMDAPPLLVYCAENTPQAADILAEHVRAALPDESSAAAMDDACFVDTVIAKMSGLAPAADGLAPIAPGDPAAFLVEAFNRILVGARCPDAAGRTRFTRGIPVFTEKPDLVPFEAAKLYCHNAGHATAAYLAQLAGLTTMDQLTARPDLRVLIRRAMVDEAGAALVHRYAGVDALFTPAAMAAYADDLIVRMVNPHLRDSVARVARDPARKLGWDDRLVGAMRLALDAGIRPRALALGVAAAWDALTAADDTPRPAAPSLRALWPAADAATAAQCVDLVTTAQAQLAVWRRAPVSTPWDLSA